MRPQGIHPRSEAHPMQQQMHHAEVIGDAAGETNARSKYVGGC